MINWRDCIVPVQRHEPEPPPKRGRPAYTASDELTALTLEARRRGVTYYGKLELGPDEARDIIAAYVASKKHPKKMST